MLYNQADGRLGDITWDTDPSDDGTDGPTDTINPAPGDTSWYEGYRAEHHAVHIDTAGNLTWVDGRPTSDVRVSGAQLRIGAGLNSNFRLITWDDDGADPDTVANPPGSGSARVLLRTYDDVEISFQGGSATATMSGGDATEILKVGDQVRFDDRTLTITAVSSATVFAFSEVVTGGIYAYTGFKVFRRGQRSAGYRIMFPGAKYAGYRIHRKGLRLRDWQLWSDGSYYGEGGSADRPTEFGLRIAEVGSDATPTVKVVDAYGELHTWEPTEDGEWWPDAMDKVLVREVAHGTTVTSFYAYFL